MMNSIMYVSRVVDCVLNTHRTYILIFSQLRQHNQTAYGYTKNSVCPQCKKVFGRSDNLHGHARLAHSLDNSAGSLCWKPCSEGLRGLASSHYIGQSLSFPLLQTWPCSQIRCLRAFRISFRPLGAKFNMRRHSLLGFEINKTRK